MPTAGPNGKFEAVVAFGGEAVRGGESTIECIAMAREAAEAENLLVVHPFADPDVVRGQAGVGIELADQVADLRRVVVPVGGGGLASGLAMAIKQIDSSVAIETPRTIADGIAVKRPGELTLPLLD